MLGKHAGTDSNDVRIKRSLLASLFNAVQKQYERTGRLLPSRVVPNLVGMDMNVDQHVFDAYIMPKLRELLTSPCQDCLTIFSLKVALLYS